MDVQESYYVSGGHPLVPESMAPYYFSLIEELRKAGQAATDEIVREAAKEGVKVHAEVVEGVPATSLLEVAKRLGSDLIVLGTHGRSSLGALLLGSTAQVVVHSTEIPVLLIR